MQSNIPVTQLETLIGSLRKIKADEESKQTRRVVEVEDGSLTTCLPHSLFRSNPV